MKNKKQKVVLLMKILSNSGKTGAACHFKTTNKTRTI